MENRLRSCQLIITTGFPETDFFTEVLCSALNLQLIKFGEVLKAASKTPDNKIKGYLDTKTVIPENMILSFLEERFSTKSGNVLLQGYPKSPQQLGLLLEMLNKIGFDLTDIWYFSFGDINAYISDKKKSDDLYIMKFGVNESRIKQQALTCELLFNELKKELGTRSKSHFVDLKKMVYSEKEAEDIIRTF